MPLCKAAMQQLQANTTSQDEAASFGTEASHIQNEASALRKKVAKMAAASRDEHGSNGILAMDSHQSRENRSTILNSILQNQYTKYFEGGGGVSTRSVSNSTFTALDSTNQTTPNRTSLLLDRLFQLTNNTIPENSTRSRFNDFNFHQNGSVYDNDSSTVNDTSITCFNCSIASVEGATRSWLLDELQLIKAVVLVVVVTLLLLSTCRILFQTMTRYDSGKSDDG